MANTSTLTGPQLDAAATATLAIPRTPQPTQPYAGCIVKFYVADANAGANAGKLVAEVNVGDGGSTVVIPCDDATVLAAAEISATPTVLKRFVVEARIRKGAV